MGNVKTSTVDESVPLNLRSVFSTEFNKMSQLLKTYTAECRSAEGRMNTYCISQTYITTLFIKVIMP